MKVTGARRRLLWAVALAVTAWLVVEAPEEEEVSAEVGEAVAPAPRRAGRVEPVKRVAEEAPVALAWERLAERNAERAKVADLFKSHSWYVPPPPKPVAPAPPPPKPVAPAAPFAYMGKLEDTPDGTVIFLSAGNKVLSVKVGETIDRTWRIDSEDAASLRLTYIPLGLPQTLSKSAKPAAAKPNENQGVPG